MMGARNISLCPDVRAPAASRRRLFAAWFESRALTRRRLPYSKAHDVCSYTAARGAMRHLCCSAEKEWGPMIVYRELETLTRDLGIGAGVLYAAGNRPEAHYRTVSITGRNGTVRTLSVPDPMLMAIQRRILFRLLIHMPVSPQAAAYRCGVSTLSAARFHIGKPVLLCLDIRHFFDNIRYADVKRYAFPPDIYAEPLRVLLTRLCYLRDALPQGAPTSPAISNLVLADFDRALTSWCAPRGIAYTRYCDDLALSGDFDPDQACEIAAALLRQHGFLLNPAKTRIRRAGTRQQVTGLIVNERPSVPREYRRALRQELYYCRRFGVASQMQRRGFCGKETSYLQSLLGRVNYLLQIRPDDVAAKQDRDWLLALLHTQQTP